MNTRPFPTVSLTTDSLFRHGTLELGPKVLFRKDERHPEILLHAADGSTVRCIDAIARFHADSARYAGYPDGIPEGTPFGEFLGDKPRPDIPFGGDLSIIGALNHAFPILSILEDLA